MRRPYAVLTAALAASLLLAGCGTTAPIPGPDGGSTPSPSAEAPAVFVPGGTAAENQAWFDATNQQVLAANASATSREFVDALAQAGFDKSAMEVTFDRTNVDLEADYIIVSVKIGDECLIGQRGPRGYVSAIETPLGTGKCLIGHTQPIDW